ncbi:type 1 fimbrial protein [Salmonella enterica]|nr:type 1 fimbrial protein [Salmonella enterica subsp. enterica serovar Lome]ECI5764789.1 type 1 fimbrial protein [Salmonella enterica subsp. enterica]ECQ1636382.1 type 1 fimbrial protein [Salmonella enterica subsp. enterica serovar Onireke]ECY3519321.1 type 1 fimbrial protein [Salmonella enterica subsp. enterica serovar Ridge]EEK6741381.1 type 1 fimbrial protein [Salmonella enterica subsp. enterica serovar Enteritidis]EIZ8936971.1 type 1 fimbrial protein [Salmonella enterica]HAD6748260.1 typ
MKRKSDLVYLIVLGALYWFASFSCSAECEFDAGNVSTTTFNIPSLVVNEDAQPGTILYSQTVIGGEANVRCHANGNILQGYTVLTSSDERKDNPITGVYQTNVPGIGIEAEWANTASSSLGAGNLITPMHLGSSKVINTNYGITVKAKVQIVVTGPVSSGVIDTSLLQADWIYDNLTIGELRFSPITVNVTANTCNLVEKNITVPLKKIMVSDIVDGYSDVVSDDRFKIQLVQCAAGIKVDYKFTTAGSTGVSGNSDILAIASGNGAAEGVGLQILDSNNNVLKFDNEYNVVAQTTDGQSASIPLKARYVQTGPVKAGKVDSVATFDVFYR